MLGCMLVNGDGMVEHVGMRDDCSEGEKPRTVSHKGGAYLCFTIKVPWFYDVFTMSSGLIILQLFYRIMHLQCLILPCIATILQCNQL